MIKSLQHKGLKRLHIDNDPCLLNPSYLRRIKHLLDMLDTIREIEGLNYSGNHLHELKGKRKGTWSVKVSGNWRLTFRFIDGNAYDVNLEDYH